MFGKSGKMEVNWALVILAAILVVIVFPTIPEKLSNLAGLAPAPGVTPTPSPTPVAGCYIEDTTMTLTSEEMYNPATTPGGDHEVWVNDHDQGLVAAGGSLTVSPGDRYKILWVANSTTHYGKVTEGVVPCAGTLKLREQLYQWDVGRAASTWATVTDEDGTLNQADATGLAMSTGDVKTETIAVRAAYEDAIGNPAEAMPNVLSCRYNYTEIDALSLDQSWASADTPNTRSTVTGTKWKSWAFPAVVSNAKTEFGITIDADDTVVTAGGSNGYETGNVFCVVDDGDYDINGDSGAIIFGVVDESDTNLGLTTGTHNFTINIS